jgi:L-fuconolactonase
MQYGGPVVDAHVHHWDPANLDWYFFLDPDLDGVFPDFGDYTRMKRLFDREVYRTEASVINLEAYVHVTTVADPRAYIKETAGLSELADRTGDPAAIIATVDPGQALDKIAADLDEQTSYSRLRGIRVLETLDYGSPKTQQFLHLLAERDLIFELLIDPAQMVDVARGLARVPSLSAVVEHAGRPKVADDPGHFALWQEGMRALADCGDRITCKISGLAMTLRTFEADRFAPWFEQCIEIFGVRRCFFASNFPIDGIWGDFNELYATYEELSKPLGADAQRMLFYSNAHSLYRC